MNIFAIAIAFAAGIALDATYNYMRKAGELRAYRDGYQQSAKEEKIRKEAEERRQFNEAFYAAPTNLAPIQPKKQILDETFMNNLHENGRAVVRIK